MLSFERTIDGRSDRVETAIHTLVVAGWTGRDEAALQRHIEELAAIGVPRPSSVPVFYRVSVSNLTQADSIEVLGPDTSGEAEPTRIARRRAWGLRSPSNFARKWSGGCCGGSTRSPIVGIG